MSSKTRHGFVILTESEDAGQALARADRVRELIKVEVAPPSEQPRTADWIV